MQAQEPLSSSNRGQAKLWPAAAYLLLSFPSGILYFVVLIVFVALSVGLLIVWIGIPMLILGMYLSWQFAIFERYLTMRWLNCYITPLALSRPPRESWLQYLRAHLTNKMTWKTLAFLLLKFPLGILSFVFAIQVPILMLVLALITFILGFVCTPILYLILVARNAPLVIRWPGQRPIYLHSMKDLVRYVFTGFGLVLLPRYILLGMAWIWQQLGRALLGMNNQDLRVAEAEEQVRREQAKVERAELSRQQLIVNVSHELRTPVASIRAHLEVLLKACAQENGLVLQPQELSNYLGIAHRETVRLGSLVEDLLSLSRTEADKLRLNMASVPPGEVIEEVYQALLPLARKERMITLVRSLSESLPRVQADHQRLTQVLMNLVRNAITYTPDGGIISISTHQKHSDYLVIAVADTGMGIPADQLTQIFERFYRTDKSRSRSSGGFGLGLSIVKDLVDAMGGKITVESQEGEGSCFHIHLRLAQGATNW
ncbi:hypothetical protein KSD_60900 [Ktedonobacter sp. SOSP1-85]|uniref:sensor histidine kinase n=1 Tax=Ktedonobacter sp. SOSP1-85 TaxID=2778367 RepID=UPI001915B197|nr:ATP-binding protein [Ktedonobacter sp. SOSP1-85]GHO78319.1 hypothetical protein KSD_60900 [Ktedonobacter sp. SOSP1-85]